jgi:diaminohydroxyphosphoribosylaminopyrimidine deaminase/5-amino-6-(5-phosphoribosylamino)uracil reductase
MEMALKIAFERMGKTSPNPAVGCVIVKNDSVIATGGTGPFGSSHAEVAALTSAGEGSAGADMYVSLEPCCHHGKTPPCTVAIIKAGISRVFIPVLDPNPLVSGKGVAELRRAGIEVTLMEEMAGYSVDLIRPFKKYILRHRPFVINKSAVTLDGRIAAKTGDSRWISSEYSRYLVHKLRSKVDAVIIGKNTFVRDNPSLNVRLDSFNAEISGYFRDRRPDMGGRDNFFLKSLVAEETADVHEPLRVVIGIPEDIDLKSNIMADGNYIFFERQDAFERLVKYNDSMRKKIDSVNLCLIDAGSSADEIRAAADELARRGVMLAMLEGGGRLAGSILDAGEIDQFLYFIAPKIAGDGIPPLESNGVDSMSDALVLRDISVLQIKDDILYNGYREAYDFEAVRGGKGCSQA